MRKLLLLLIVGGLMASCGSSKRSISKNDSNYKRSISKEEFKNKKYQPVITKEGKVNKDESVSKVSKGKREDPDLAAKIVDYAKSYMGTKYQYGGMSKKGMDCSGLVYLSFLNVGDIFLPRSSREIAKQGEKIKLNQVRKGDLVFFKTTSRNVISHLGLVVKNKHGNVEFIHSSTKRGVMISGMKEAYWTKNFAEARRIL